MRPLILLNAAIKEPQQLTRRTGRAVAVLPRSPPARGTTAVAEALQAAGTGSRREGSNVEVPPHGASPPAARLEAPLPARRAARRMGTGPRQGQSSPPAPPGARRRTSEHLLGTYCRYSLVTALDGCEWHRLLHQNLQGNCTHAFQNIPTNQGQK